MNGEIMAEARKLGKAFHKTGMRYMLPVIMIVAITVSAACAKEETFSLGERVSDDAHAFQPVSAKLIDKVGETTPPEEHSYLIIEYEIENVQSQQDISREWSQQIGVEDIRGEEGEPISLSDLEDQLWNTTLSPQQKEAGSMAFTILEKARDFKLTFRFPVSGTVAVYEFRAEDERLEIRVSYVLESMEQIERTRRLPVIGRAIDSFTRMPVQYQGEVLVPEEDIIGLLEQLQGLTEETRRGMIEDYLREQRDWG